MFKIIICACKILLMFKIITCTYKNEKEIYWLSCKDYTKNNNPKIVRNRRNRLMIQSNCANCGNKNLDLLKNNRQWEY